MIIYQDSLKRGDKCGYFLDKLLGHRINFFDIILGKKIRLNSRGVKENHNTFNTISI